MSRSSPSMWAGTPEKGAQGPLLFFLLLLLLPVRLPAQELLIGSLTPEDLYFRQYAQDVADNRRRLATGSPASSVAASLTLYRYRVVAGEDLLSIAARCTIPYDAIATLNRLDRIGSLKAGQVLLLPSAPGLYLSDTARNDMELLLRASRADEEGAQVRVPDGERTRMVLYLRDAFFSPTERAFFLNAGFRFPLPAARVTSGFGVRRHPITGKMSFHAGIDLAAPTGTPVYATRDGTVTATGEDPILGRYVTISHEGGWVSVYGHLSTIETGLRNEVRSGSIIGKVGTTGQSTGPHLHFELRQGGSARDPAGMLPRGNAR